jgi:hypothetical protein
VDAEVAWLKRSGDGLPSLLEADGGPWQVVQAYWPRTLQTRSTGIYLLAPQRATARVATQRRRPSMQFRAKCWWPIGSTTTSTGLWEDEQRALDDALDLLIERIEASWADHTHGGAFLSVAEAPGPGRITVHYSDPEQTAAASPACLLCEVLWDADGREYTA